VTVLELYNFSNILQWAGSIAVAACCLLYFNKRQSAIKTLGFYGITSILFSFAQRVVIWLSHGDYLNSIGNIYALMEAWTISLLFYFAYHKSSFRKTAIAFAVIYTASYLVTFLFFADRSYSFVRFGRDSLMIAQALIYFFFLLSKLPEEDLLKFPMFWINSAVIFFFSGTFVLSLMADYITTVLNNDLTGFWAFRNFFRFSFCLILAYAGWLDYKAIKTASVNS
jgi:hypothetical protein